jgi:hypothetical protein
MKVRLFLVEIITIQGSQKCLIWKIEVPSKEVVHKLTKVVMVQT